MGPYHQQAVMGGNKSFISKHEGEFHKYGFVWYAGDRVEFYVDDVHLYTSRRYVPTRAGRLVFGPVFLWWGGPANFDYREVLVKSVKITPVAHPNDRIWVQQFDQCNSDATDRTICDFNSLLGDRCESDTCNELVGGGSPAACAGEGPRENGCSCGHKWDCKSYECAGSPPVCAGLIAPPPPPSKLTDSYCRPSRVATVESSPAAPFGESKFEDDGTKSDVGPSPADPTSTDGDGTKESNGCLNATSTAHGRFISGGFLGDGTYGIPYQNGNDECGCPAGYGWCSASDRVQVNGHGCYSSVCSTSGPAECAQQMMTSYGMTIPAASNTYTSTSTSIDVLAVLLVLLGLIGTIVVVRGWYTEGFICERAEENTFAQVEQDSRGQMHSAI